jgi:ATP-dependent Lon protease
MPATVLVVEDDRWGRKIISDTLRKDGYEVVEVTDGAQAVEILEYRSFDLIVTDFVMPNLDGLKLVDHVHRVSPQTRIILISGYLSVDPGNKILEGSAEFLPKPFDFNVLRSMARRLVPPDPIPC